MTKFAFALALAMSFVGNAFAADLTLKAPGPYDTKDGDNIVRGKLSNVSVVMHREYTRDNSQITVWKLGYHFYNGCCNFTQKGTQTMYIDLLDKNNFVVVPNVIAVPVNRSHCWYNGGRDFGNTGQFAFDYTDKGIDHINVHFDPIVDRQGKC